MSTVTLIPVCDITDIPENCATLVEVDDLEIAVYNLNGEFFATDDLCTHGPGSLSEGCIRDGKVECDFHGGEFDIRTGEAITAPCMIPLKTYKTKVEGKKVYVEIEED